MSTKGIDLQRMIAEAVAAAMATAPATAKPAAPSSPKRQTPAAPAPLSFRVSTKGAVSVYGLGRFPVTLYGNQWDRLLGEAGNLKRYIDTNRDKLTTLDRGA